MLLGRTRLGMMSKAILTWSHTRALMTASSQKTDLDENLWKINSQRTQRILLRPHHFIENITNTTSTSKEEASNPADNTPSLTNFKCNVCGRVYKNRNFLNLHFRKSSNCQVRTASLPGFLPPEPERLPKTPKPKAPKPDSGARPYVCANCNKSFKTANELGKHRKRSEKCILSRGEQEEEDRLTMEMIKALGAEGPFVFPEPKKAKKEKEKKVRERKPAAVKESNLRWKRELRSLVATIGGAHEVARCLDDNRIHSYIVESPASELNKQYESEGLEPFPAVAIVDKSKEEKEAEESELKELIKAIRSNEELKERLEAAKEKFTCQWCEKEFKTKKGFMNHESKGCKKKPLTPEEAAALKLAEEQERNVKIRAELVATRRPLLAAWFDIMVNKGRVGEAFDDFQLLRSEEKWREVVESTKVYDILLR